MKLDFNQIKGVIFDLDGTITDSESMYRQTWLDTMADWGLPRDISFTEEICGTNKKSALGIIKKHFPQLDDPIGFRTDCMDRMVVKFREEPIPLQPGAEKLIKALHNKGIPIAIGSGNVHETINDNLTKVGLIQYFDAIVGDEDVTYGKPNPELFEKASASLGLPPEKCLVIEDSNSGIEAGHAAGCKTCMVIDTAPPTEHTKQIADWIIESLVEVEM